MIDKLFRWGYFIVVIAIVASTMMVIYPKYLQSVGLQQAKEELDRRIILKNDEIAAVKEMQNRFRTDREFVESLARKDRRMFPGELVFVFEQ